MSLAGAITRCATHRGYRTARPTSGARQPPAAPSGIPERNGCVS